MVWKTPIFGCMERMDICCCSCFVGPLFAGTFFLENISNIFCIFTLNKNFNKNFSEKCRIHRWKSGALVYGKFHPMWSRYSSEYDQKEAWYWRISCYGYCLLHVSRHITLSPLCHHYVTVLTLHRHEVREMPKSLSPISNRSPRHFWRHSKNFILTLKWAWFLLSSHNELL